jgi:catabolite regulation protein CreA
MKKTKLDYLIFIGLSVYLLAAPFLTEASKHCLTQNTIMQKNKKVDINFNEDPKIEEIMLNYAHHAIATAKKHFGINLDWSDNSIKNVELILENLHETAKADKPSEEDIYTFAQIFGSYVGQVFKRNHNAEWGTVTIGNEKLPGLRTKRGNIFWPWGKANNRITNGKEDNIFHYYQVLVKDESEE